MKGAEMQKEGKVQKRERLTNSDEQVMAMMTKLRKKIR